MAAAAASAAAAPCPICFEESEEGAEEARRSLIRGRYCNHGFCKPCLNKILLVSPDSDTLLLHPPPLPPPPVVVGDDDGDSDSAPLVLRHPSDVALVGVPTQGACPICRARLSLFDMRWINHDGEGTAEEEVYDSEEEDSDGNSLSGKSPAGAYQNEIVSGWRRTPLVGRVYASKQGIGYSSYHFDPNDPDFPAEHPYMNCTSAVEHVGMRPRSLHASMFAIRKCRWHVPSRTLRGSMDGGDEILLSFAANLRSVRASAIVRRPIEVSCLEELHDLHPFDGTYRVVRLDCDDDRAGEAAPATRHAVTGGKVTTLDRMPDQAHIVTVHKGESSVHIRCYGYPEAHREARFCFRRRPAGPLEGDTVRFRLPGIAGGRRSSHSVFEEWTMTRKSTSAPPSDVAYVGPTGASNTYYRHWSAAEQLPPISPKYVGAELWGNSFCQYGSSVGQESYHFAMPPSHSGKIVAYVSYASPGGHPFGPLDDGSNMPERAYFRNATYDASTRTFVGSLKWLDDWGVTLGQMKRWDIKLRFDTEFTCILSGLVKAYPASGADGTVTRRIGKDQLFYNAALDEHLCKLLGIETQALGGPGPHDAMVLRAARTIRFQLQGPITSASVVNRCQPLLDRLTSEGAKPRTVDGCRQLFVDACHRLAAIG
jgi:Zinc finger, C3HC4 type (RING finger)